MIRVDVPKTPAQRWRELSANEKAFRLGVIMRLGWELLKPVLAWTAFILLLGVWAVVTVILGNLLPKK